jgi:pimeloyl-ACP methyl ester carboxylesterase
MAIIVLVHGAWQSARTWDYLRPMLEDKGHEVIIPILSGLGQDAANLSEKTSLHQHIEDVCRAMISKGAQEVLLVGHDYGGIVITGVVEKMPERIARLFFIESLILEDQQCALDFLPPLHGEDWLLPAHESLLADWGLPDGGARDFCRERLCDFSRHCFADTLDLPLQARQHLDCCYLECTADYYSRPAHYLAAAAKARELGWTVDSIPTGHLPQAEAPRELAEILIRRETPSAHLIG